MPSAFQNPVQAGLIKITPMKNLYKLIVLSGMALFLGSCYYDTYPEEEELPLPEEVSYAEDIQPLWDRDCVSCHPSQAAPDLRAGTSYNSLLNGYVEPGNSAESVLYQSLLGINNVSLMPPSGRWSNNDINLVKKWIDDGAENN